MQCSLCQPLEDLWFNTVLSLHQDDSYRVLLFLSQILPPSIDGEPEFLILVFCNMKPEEIMRNTCCWSTGQYEKPLCKGGCSWCAVSQPVSADTKSFLLCLFLLEMWIEKEAPQGWQGMKLLCFGEWKQELSRGIPEVLQGEGSPVCYQLKLCTQ